MDYETLPPEAQSYFDHIHPEHKELFFAVEIIKEKYPKKEGQTYEEWALDIAKQSNTL